MNKLIASSNNSMTDEITDRLAGLSTLVLTGHDNTVVAAVADVTGHAYPPTSACNAADSSMPALKPVSAGLPQLIADGGHGARFAWEEFFHGHVRNTHTRRSYQRSARHFLHWGQSRGLALHTIAPAHVGQFLDELPDAVASKKVYLAGIRHLFDMLVMRHAVVLNPAASVRTERYQVIEGKTPEITVDQARRLLASVKIDSVVGLRDRAIIAMLIYTAARVGAVARLRLRDFYDSGDQYCLRFLDKGGKSREIPVRHDLQGFLFAYITAAEIGHAPTESPLFRSTIRRTKILTNRGLTADDIGRMVKRRMRQAGLPARLSPHSFRVTTITDLLSQGVPLEEVQHLAGHSDPRTTRLYDRRQRRVTRNIVERISI
jgi:site-specific recombinase XerD